MSANSQQGPLLPADGKIKWFPFLHEFWVPFNSQFPSHSIFQLHGVSSDVLISSYSAKFTEMHLQIMELFCVICSAPEFCSATSSCFKLPDLWSPSQPKRLQWATWNVSFCYLFGKVPVGKSQCSHQAQLICFPSGVMILWFLLFKSENSWFIDFVKVFFFFF